MHNGTIAYSRYLDHYQYRVLSYINETWQETSKGPFIDRKQAEGKVWMCTGLETLGSQLLVSAVRGPLQAQLNHTVEVHGGERQARVFETRVPAHAVQGVMNLDAFSQLMGTTFSQEGSGARVGSFFGGQLYLAFDAGANGGHLVYETLKRSMSRWVESGDEDDEDK